LSFVLAVNLGLEIVAIHPDSGEIRHPSRIFVIPGVNEGPE
jgi:hypothetical protein